MCVSHANDMLPESSSDESIGGLGASDDVNQRQDARVAPAIDRRLERDSLDRIFSERHRLELVQLE